MSEHKNSDKYIIGIAGGSGSGKTTFIKKLKESFKKNEVCVISQDNYYKKKEEQKIDAKGIKNFDLPYSIELEDFYNDIKKLKSGQTVIRQEYTFNNSEAKPKEIRIEPAPIIIAEGLFVFCDDRLNKLFNLKIMIDATDDKKIIRRIKRDRIERNYPLEDVLYRYEHHVIPAYEKYIEPFKKDVDMIINNNVSFSGALLVLKAFIKSRL